MNYRNMTDEELLRCAKVYTDLEVELADRLGRAMDEVDRLTKEWGEMFAATDDSQEFLDDLSDNVGLDGEPAGREYYPSLTARIKAVLICAIYAPKIIDVPA